jgi:hypothetical protein
VDKPITILIYTPEGYPIYRVPFEPRPGDEVMYCGTQRTVHAICEEPGRAWKAMALAEGGLMYYTVEKETPK